MAPKGVGADEAFVDGEAHVFGAEHGVDRQRDHGDGEHGHHGSHSVAHHGQASESCVLAIVVAACNNIFYVTHLLQYSSTLPP